MRVGQELQKRKKNRLENYDYSSCGAYFITICTVGRQNFFGAKFPTIVGATIGHPKNNDYLKEHELSQCGAIVDEAVNHISSTYPSLVVDSYVIMPNHINILLRVCADESGRPMVAPTVSRVISQLKGYVTKRAKKVIWQKSFYDHIIRNREDYNEHLKYIYENPIRWQYDEVYVE